MTINLSNHEVITYDQWKTLTPQAQNQIAVSLGFDPRFIDTQLSAGEQIQGGGNAPSGGEQTPSTDKPNLTAPSWSLISPESFSLIQEFLQTLGLSMEDATTSFSPEGSLENNLALVQGAIDDFLSNGEIQSQPEDSPQIDVPTERQEVATGLSALWKKIEQRMNKEPGTFSPEQEEISKNIASNDPAKVKEALLKLVNLDARNLTPEQKTLVEGKLDELSKSIASSIEEGGKASFFIKLGIPELLTVQFATAIDLPNDTTLSPQDQELLVSVLKEAADNLSEVNLAEATQLKPPSEEFVQLTSQDPAKLSTLLKTLFSAIQIPESTMTETERSQLIMALSTEFASKDTPLTKLTSSKEEIVNDALSETIEKLVKEGKIPANIAETLKNNPSILASLAKQISAINEKKCLNNLYSNDETVIEGALRNLGEVPSLDQSLSMLKGLGDTPLPDAVAQQFGQSVVIESYLKALVAALSFMAKIRCAITNLEGTLSLETANAKMKALADQIQTAISTYDTEMEKATTEAASQLKQIAKAALMKWIMPLITMLVTIIMTIITVAVSILTAGAATGPLAAITAAVIVKLVVITLTITMAVITVIDAALSMAGKKGVWEMATDGLISCFASGDQPAWLKSLVNAIIQIVITVTIGLLTLGAGVMVAATTSALKSINSALTGALGSFLNEIPKMLAKEAVLLTMTAVVMPLLSSGLLMNSILEIIKAACGDKDQEKNMIIAMIVMIVITIAIMIAGMKIQSSLDKLLSGATSAAKNVADSAGKTIKDQILELLASLKTNLAAAGKGVAEAAQAPFKDLAEFLQSILKAFVKAGALAVKEVKEADTILDKLLSFIKSIGTSAAGSFNAATFIRALQTSTQLLQMCVQIYSAKTSFDQAHLQEKLAELTEKMTEFEASLSLITTLTTGSLDQTATIKKLGEDARARGDEWAEMIHLVSSFIQDASKNLNALTTSGAY